MYQNIFKAALFVVLVASCKTSDSQQQYTNHLIHESSPYLLQHAHNPVDWHPWGPEALQEAVSKDKMLLISIGYAACHWCHVMEKESFEDTAVARIMNEHFINIKVDREERPDVDDIYMTACHLSSEGGCGWPLNAFALPDGKPVWAGTYFPKENWIEILEYFIEVRETEPEKLKEFATQLAEGIQQAEQISANPGEQQFAQDAMSVAMTKLLEEVDKKAGGTRSSAPKFPMPNTWELLLAWYHFTDSEPSLDAVKTTLDRMAMGGIYDHLGGGFARYSVDAEWHIPHFEKMLYDNAQLVSLYSHAWQVTSDSLYMQTVSETLDFVARELTAPEGVFYSSLDADSEGEEGKFYVWTYGEIEKVLQQQKVIDIFNDYYGIEKNGNWEHDKNVLIRRKAKEKIAHKHKVSIARLDSIIASAKSRLFQSRAERPRPRLDDKSLTSWNGLMIKGYADAYEAFNKPAYKAAALKAGHFLADKMMQSDGRLVRNYKDGKAVINAFLDDYANTIMAFLALYEITFDEVWLRRADTLANYTVNHFKDAGTGMFFYSSDQDPDLIARRTEVTDNVIPASNSTMARGLYDLGHYLYKDEYLDQATQMLHNMKPAMLAGPAAYYSNWWQLWLDVIRPPYEVAIVGPDFESKKVELSAHFLPNALLLGGAAEGNLELLEGKLLDGETMIYVCKNKVCKLPVKKVERALTLMK